MKPDRNHFIACVISLLLWACAMGPNFRRPEVKSPDTWRNTAETGTDSALNLKWWEIFGDETLNALIQEALANNKDVLIAASRVDESRANLGMERSQFYPSIGLGSGIYKGNYGGGLFIFGQEREAFAVNGQLSWELDFWGRVRRSTESAKAGLLNTEYGHRTVQIGIITEVARNYFQLLDYRSRYEISQRTFASRDSGHKIIEARFKGGVVPEIDVNQSQIQLSIARAAVPAHLRQINVAENNLSILLGRMPGEINVSATLYEKKILSPIPAGIPSGLLDRRPDLLAAEAELHSQTARVGIAQASRLPVISLTGLFGVVTPDLTSFAAGGSGWNAGASLTGPLFEFGRNQRRVVVERERTEQALHRYENAVMKAFSEVELSLRNIETLKEEVVAREEQYAAATNAEHLSFERYNKGVTSYLEVLENQRASFEAGLIYSQTYQEYLSAHVLLYKSLGGGWVSEEEMKAAETQKEQK